jgi:putative transposase
MGCRKEALVTGCFYHVFTKSIAGFEVFRYRDEYLRMLETFQFYQCPRPGVRFSRRESSNACISSNMGSAAWYVRLIAYCIMPTHVHFMLEQRSDDGISEFMRLTLNSYARYFNEKTGRKGPLLESRFENRMISTDDHALHMTRYIHLNPSSAGLVPNPEDWEFSSYKEYLGLVSGKPICEFRTIVPLSPLMYRKFSEDRADYQRSLQILKKYLVD